jgi:hypothetical protein
MKEELKLIDNKCKFCQTPLEHRFIDIIISGQRDQNIGTADSCQDPDFPLPTYICTNCFLVQINESCLSPIRERAFVSSFGSSWLTDIKQFTDNIFEHFESTDRNLTVTLLNQNDTTHQRDRDDSFSFGTNGLHSLIDMYGKADSINCRDELARVHDINDFISGLKLFLKPTGTISMQFLHLLPIIEGNQVKTIDSACFPYLSFTTADTILKKHGLEIYDLGNNPSQEWLRILVKHASDTTRHISNRVTALRGKERSLGMSSLQCYTAFKDKSPNSLPVKEELYLLSRQ